MNDVYYGALPNALRQASHVSKSWHCPPGLARDFRGYAVMVEGVEVSVHDRVNDAYAALDVLGPLTPVPGAEPRYDDDGKVIVSVMTCGHCGRSWNDAAISDRTPVPSARCPFEEDHEYPTFVVIENTPGYMPDDDDPATFEDRESAVHYLRDEVERLCEHILEGDGDPHVVWSEERDSAHVTDSTREHDLGRVFEIHEEEDDE